MKHVKKSAKLANVCYDIRGPVLQKAKQMEEEGHKIIKLNIGNLAAFGFAERPVGVVEHLVQRLEFLEPLADEVGQVRCAQRRDEVGKTFALHRDMGAQLGRRQIAVALDDGIDNGGIFAIHRKIAHKGLVYLQIVYGQMLQIAQA